MRNLTLICVCIGVITSVMHPADASHAPKETTNTLQLKIHKQMLKLNSMAVSEAERKKVYAELAADHSRLEKLFLQEVEKSRESQKKAGCAEDITLAAKEVKKHKENERAYQQAAAHHAQEAQKYLKKSTQTL